MYDEIWNREVYRFADTDGPKRIIDCGANIGLASLFFHSNYPGSTITAVEADPENFRLLESNVAHCENGSVTCLNRAVAGSHGTVPFQSQASSTRSSIVQRSASTIDVEAITLSELIGDSEVEFLKIDIEGAEYDALEESRSNLNKVKRLFVELHGRRGSRQLHGIAFQILEEAGFRVHVESSGPVPKHPFIEPMDHHGIDVLINVFAFRPDAS